MKLKDLDWGGFVMNFLAVVLGIGITFGGEEIISSIHQKNEARENLKLLAEELHENMKNIHIADSVMKMDSRVGDFMERYEGKYQSAPKDSMQVYTSALFMMHEISPVTDVFELLKSANVFIEIDDKDLSVDIMRAYDSLKDLLTLFNYYNKDKQKYVEGCNDEDVQKLVATGKNDPASIMGVVSSKPSGRMWFHELQASGAAYDISETEEKINKVLKQIEVYD